jgi:hypothetical protein
MKHEMRQNSALQLAKIEKHSQMMEKRLGIVEAKVYEISFKFNYFIFSSKLCSAVKIIAVEWARTIIFVTAAIVNNIQEASNFILFAHHQSGKWSKRKTYSPNNYPSFSDSTLWDVWKRKSR